MKKLWRFYLENAQNLNKILLGMVIGMIIGLGILFFAVLFRFSFV